MPEIVSVISREILDSRGNPTVETEVYLSSGAWGRAAVPSGASTGEHEALELRDGDDRFGGKGVRKAVENVLSVIAPAVSGLSALRTRELDEIMIELDGSADKSRLGANATLSVSMAAARAGSLYAGLPLYGFLGGTSSHLLPVPMMNIMNGGRHASNNIDIQEFMVLPVGFPSFARALRAGAEVYHSLRRLALERGFPTSVGDEGGLAPDLDGAPQAMDMIMEAIGRAGYEAGRDFFLAIDAAASEFYRDGRYVMESEDGGSRTSGQMVDYWEDLAARYPLVSLEDALEEDDWEGWSLLTRRLGGRIHLVGDDIFVTSMERLSRGVREGIANAILIKPNQIGTVSETLDAIGMARRSGYRCVISHRSGETCDTFISDLAVACNAGFIKTGAPCRTDRVAKYNQLLRIEQELGDVARYAGLSVLPGGLVGT